MAPSLHQQLFFDGEENIKNFEEAWAAQSDRKQLKSIPYLCRNPQFLLYGEACSLGAQMERLLANVPRERILPILLDDIRDDTNKVWLDILSFLNVPDDGRREFPVENKAKERRFTQQAYIQRIYYEILRKMKISPLGFGFFSYLDKFNAREKLRSELSPKMELELKNYFENDIKLLSRLLNRDLTNWL